MKLVEWWRAVSGRGWSVYTIQKVMQLNGVGDKWTMEKIEAALENLVADGYMEKLPNGTYKPTELGRLVIEMEKHMVSEMDKHMKGKGGES